MNTNDIPDQLAALHSALDELHFQSRAITTEMAVDLATYCERLEGTKT